jgi:hypothetical protein
MIKTEQIMIIKQIEKVSLEYVKKVQEKHFEILKFAVCNAVMRRMHELYKKT